MNSLSRGKRKVSRRVAGGLVLLAVAAPAALASSASVRRGRAPRSSVRQGTGHQPAPAPARQGTVHTYIDRSGTVVVSGYDGGVALAPAASAAQR